MNLTNAQECNFTLSGIVLSGDSSRVLVGAYLKILGTNRVTSTDTRGYFEFTNLCTGSYFIESTHIGFSALRKEIYLDRNSKLNFIHNHKVSRLVEFEITETNVKRNFSKHLSTSIEEHIFLSSQNLGKMSEKMPGITTFNTGQSISKPVINGMQGNRIIIYNNGVRQEEQQWGNEHATAVDPFSIHNLQLVSGAESFRYSQEAIGGIIEIKPNNLEQDSTLQGEVISSNSSNGRGGLLSSYLQGSIKPIKGLHWRLQGSVKQLGNIQTPSYFLANSGLKERNFSWNFVYRIKKIKLDVFYSQFNTELGIFSGSHFGSLSDLQRAINSSRPTIEEGFSYKIGRPYQNVVHETTRMLTEIALSETSKLEVKYSRQFNARSEFDFHNTFSSKNEQKELPDFKMNLTTHQTAIEYHKDVNNRISLLTGGSYFNQKNTVSGRIFIPNYEKNNYSLYSILWMEFIKWRFEGAVRYDYIEQQSFFYKLNELQTPKQMFDGFSGSISSTYFFGYQLKTQLELSYNWRAPHVSELFSNGLHHGAASIEIGDIHLQAEHGRKLKNLWSYSQKNQNIYFESFLQYVDNFIYLIPSPPATLTIRGAFPTFRYQAVDAILYGVNIQGENSLSEHLFINYGASLLRAQNHNTRRWLTQMPGDRIQITLGYKLNDHKLIQKMKLQAGVSSVGKQRRTDERDFAPPPPAYSIINIETSGIVMNGNKKLFKVSFGISNLLNTTYRDYMNRFRYFADEIGRNFQLSFQIPIINKTP